MKVIYTYLRVVSEFTFTFGIVQYMIINNSFKEENK